MLVLCNTSTRTLNAHQLIRNTAYLLIAEKETFCSSNWGARGQDSPFLALIL
jgi:hypothetical protein